MKKLYIILLSSLLAVMTLVGLWSLVDRDPVESEVENRRLASKPEFSWSSLWDGSYFRKLETYYSDTFPGREKLLEANRTLNGFYYFTGGSKDNMLVVDFDSNVGEGGQAAKPTQPQEGQQPADSQQGTQKPDGQKPAQKPQEPEQKPQEPEPQKEPEPNYDDMECTATSSSIILVGDNAMDIPTASEDMIIRFAEAVNALQTALGESVRVLPVAVPTSGQFYSPKDYHTGSHDQGAMIGLLHSNLLAAIPKTNAFQAIEAHKQEEIYFRTDHHWTALGAYYAYTAFCQAAGWEPVPLEEFTTGTYQGFVGSMYQYTSQYPQSQALKDNPDDLTYYLPKATSQAKFYPNGDMNPAEGIAIDVINKALPESEKNKYMCFLSGDHPLIHITTSSQGGVALVLKDSYGNAFIPFLTNHYKEIYVVDPREFNADGRPTLDLTAFVKEHAVEDVITVNYTFSVNNLTYIKRLEALVAASGQ